MTRPVYRLLDHTADMAYEVAAPTWAELLDAATAALGDVILAEREHDTAGELAAARAFEVDGADREDVLVAVLNEAVLLFDDEAFLARRARCDHADERSARGVLRGRLLSLGSEEPDRVVKAVTYHDLAVVEGAGEEPWRATIVLDL